MPSNVAAIEPDFPFAKSCRWFRRATSRHRGRGRRVSRAGCRFPRHTEWVGTPSVRVVDRADWLKLPITGDGASFGIESRAAARPP